MRRTNKVDYNPYALDVIFIWHECDKCGYGKNVIECKGC